MIVGGPQYRAGSHRQFVRVSRALARAGYAVLRMDYRGMGDSEGDQRDFLGVEADIKAGIDALFDQVPSMQRAALWGLCDAASASLLYLHATRDRRIGGEGVELGSDVWTQCPQRLGSRPALVAGEEVEDAGAERVVRADGCGQGEGRRGQRDEAGESGELHVGLQGGRGIKDP